jgi:hypothetical protein
MPNINVRKAIERISDELERVGNHIVQHSGIAPKDAMFIDNVATGIAETAAQIAGIARQAQGSTETPQELTRKTRRALGFTNP